MRQKSICVFIFLLLASAAGACRAADLAPSVVPVYFTGETGVKFGSGVVVGDGSYVVTSADLTQEQIGPKTNRTVKFPLVLVPSTGEAYRAETVSVDTKGNIAVLKLPVSGIQAAALADASTAKSAPYITLGQMLTEDSPGGRWPTRISAYSRNKESGKMELTDWNAGKAFFTEAKGSNWLFLSDVSPDTPVPAGAVVTKADSSILSLYVSRFTIEGGSKPVVLRMTAPGSTLTAALQKAGASAADLKKPPVPTYKPDGKEAEAFQMTSRALAAILSGSWEKAVTETKSLVDLRNANASAQMLYGVALAGSGKAEDALKAMNKALEIDPKLAGGHLNRGVVYASLKKYKEAEADYRKAMEMAPRDIRPISWLAGIVALDEKRLDESAQLAERAAKIEPENPSTHVAVARVLTAKKDFEKATSELQEALKIAPSLGVARAALGTVYEAAGKTDEAEKVFRKFAEDEVKSPDAQFELAAFLQRQGKNEEAKKLAAKILEMNPSADLKSAVEELMKKTDEKH